MKSDVLQVESRTQEPKVGDKTYHVGTFVAVDEVVASLLAPHRYSSWLKLKRIQAWINRFFGNCQRKGTGRISRELTVDELQQAEIQLIKQTQRAEFPEEWKSLAQGRPLPASSKLFGLKPKLDDDGLVRSDGRLKNARFLSYDVRYPVILPRKCWLTKLIIKDALVADLFLFCYERDFMTSLSDVKQAEIIEAFKSTSRYLDDLLNIDNPYFEVMVNRIYPPELQLNKANTSDTEAPFLDLHLSISNGFVSSKIYDKCDDFDFDIVNFPFLDGDVPRSTSYGVYISQLIRFARVSSHVVDFNARNKSLTAKLLQQGYRYHKLRKTFSKFYRRHYELVSKFNVGLKTLLHQGLSEPEFYGDLVYKFKKILGRADFSDQFRKIIVRYKRIGYNINIMRQSACLVFNQSRLITLLPSLIARRWVGRQTQ